MYDLPVDTRHDVHAHDLGARPPHHLLQLTKLVADVVLVEEQDNPSQIAQLELGQHFLQRRSP